MPVSIDDFWKLTAASELLSADECRQLDEAFEALKGASEQANARSLAQWLVATGKLTRYQAAILTAGRPGPFVFGPFTITDRIETGRLARLYRATYHNSQQALLIFLAQLTDEAREHEHLVGLAQAAAAVKNPHVSRTYNAVRQRSQTFIVVEALEGRSLAEVLAENKIAPPAATRLAFQVALALVAMHAEKLVHGSVSPQNIWIDANGTAKLLQFPLVPVESRLARFEPPLVDYLAPELADRGPRATALTDIYGLGCTLFELLAGRVVFPGGSPRQKFARHRTEFPQRLDQLDPTVPEELADLVSEMLTKDPLLRCQTASHVLHLLAPFATGEQPRASRPPKLNPVGLTPGYGAWKAPDWRSPPPQAPRATVAERPVEPKPPAAESAAADEADQPAAPIEPAIVVGATGEARTSRRTSPAEAPLVVTDSGSTLGVGLPERRASKSTLVGIGAGLALVAVVVIGAVIVHRNERMAASPGSAAASAARVDDRARAESNSDLPNDALPRPDQASTAGPATEATAANNNLVDDDGQTLWVSPTNGRPIDPAYLPSGAQVLLVVRPAELWQTAEGPRLVEALGPGGEWAQSWIGATLGVEPADVEQLMIAFVPDEAHAPQAALVMRLARDIPPEALLAAWGNPAAKEERGKKYYEGAEHAYYLPEPGAGRVVAVAPPALLKKILEIEGPPLLQSSVERLLARSDDRRHVSLLFTPSYLLTDGKELLVGHLAELRGRLAEFLDESIDAVLLSAHVGDELFLEFRAVAPVDRPPLELAELLRSRFDKIPDRVETHIASLEPDPYGRLVINRFPRMLQLARDFTRGGVDEGQVVMRAYLPASAAHNLLMGAELTLLESSGTAPAQRSAPPPAATIRSIAETLHKKISLSIPRESLDRVLEILAKELGVEIVILGPDFQTEGITKNQSLNNVDERDQPADAILRKVLKLANPDGKLAYVIKPNERGVETIFITTRQAAAKRGDKLPEGF